MPEREIMKALGAIILIAGLALAGYTAYDYSISSGIFVHEFEMEKQPLAEFRVLGPIEMDYSFHRSRLRIEMTTKKKGGVHYDLALTDEAGDKIWETRGILSNERDTKTLFRENLPFFFVPKTQKYYILYKFTANAMIEHASVSIYKRIGEIDKNFLWISVAAVVIGLFLFIWGVNKEMPHRHKRLSDNEFFERITK
jgi:hypothetical protein